MSGESEALRPIATRALDYVARGTVVGLGTGRAASAFVEALGERVRDGLDVRGVPTSEATASLAAKVGIPLLSLDHLDWCVRTRGVLAVRLFGGQGSSGPRTEESPRCPESARTGPTSPPPVCRLP